MKKLRFLFLLSAASLVLTACNKDDDNTPITVTELPQTAQTYLASNFSGMPVASAFRDNDGYKVTMKDYEIEFYTDGSCDDIKAYGAPLPESVLALLPPSIPAYVAANYPAYRIIEIDYEAWGYEIELNDYQGTELFFDTSGSFTRKEANRADNANVDPNTLPAEVKTFLTTHFSGLAVQKAEKDGNEYEVYLAGYSLEFRLDGTWKSIESYGGVLPQSVVNLLPQATLTYLNTNYQGVGVQEMDFEGTKYEVQLANSTRTELEFNAQGNFLRIDR